MLHMFLPFDQHFDSGFGAVAVSFRYSADALNDNPPGVKPSVDDQNLT